MKQQAAAEAMPVRQAASVGRIIHVLGRQKEVRPAIIYKVINKKDQQGQPKDELVHARVFDEGGDYDYLNLKFSQGLEKQSQWTWPPR